MTDVSGPPPDADVVLAGGGLANVLIALRLKAVQPQVRTLIIERGATLGGNHTWSFHDSDVSDAERAWLQPLIETHWNAQEVRFPKFRRRLETGYNSIPSERLHDVALAELGSAAVLFSAAIADLTPTEVRLADGRVLRAGAVIDGRGPVMDAPLAFGYQKFVGLEIECEAPHGIELPIIMDATVEQFDGYRFMYSLPFTPTRILLEDTFYADGPENDDERLRGTIRAYAQAKGIRIARVIREEAGVLPITLAGDIDKFWRRMGPEIPRSGLRALLFHPTTGYSLGLAARVADMVANLSDLNPRAIASRIERFSRTVWTGQKMFRLLNRMLFLAATPAERRGVLERHYTMPEPLIQRFYAGRLTSVDCVRILSGKPPVAMSRAMTALGESGAWTFAAARPAAVRLG